jgi:pimeloyl-ACP methyl ester carboxylesterase
MGGWIMLLAALARIERIHGLVGIAAAPDFTENLWLHLDDAQRKACCKTGAVTLPSKYDPIGYTYPLRLFEDGRRHLVTRAEIPLAPRRARREPGRYDHSCQGRRPPAVERR